MAEKKLICVEVPEPKPTPPTVSSHDNGDMQYRGLFDNSLHHSD